jgi:hypothetical protein
MARVYMITEAEMQGLMDQLELKQMSDKNVLIHPDRFAALTPEERNRLEGVHRAFHFVCVRWAQDMGFKGGRF